MDTSEDIDQEVPGRQTVIKHGFGHKLLVGGGLAVALLTAGVIVYAVRAQHPSPSPLPGRVVASLHFTVYYPDALPASYALVSGSAKAANQILFFSVSNGQSTMFLSEQNRPLTAPSIENVQDNAQVQHITIPDGYGFVGLYKTLPFGFVITRTTLISLSSSGSVTPDDAAALMRSLAVISR